MMRVVICSKVSRAPSSTSLETAEVMGGVTVWRRLLTVFPQADARNYAGAA